MSHASGFTIDMIDVGHGDSFVVSSSAPGGRVVLVDVGPSRMAGRVWDYLREHHSTEPDAVVLTHIDNDHIGGMAGLLDLGLRPKNVNFNDPREAYTAPVMESVLKKSGMIYITSSVSDSDKTVTALRDRGMVPQLVVAGTVISLDDNARLRVLSPTWQDFTDAIPGFRNSNLEQLIEKKASRQCSYENMTSVVLDMELASGKPGAPRANVT